MTKPAERILFLGRYGCGHSSVFATKIQSHFSDVSIYLDGDPDAPPRADVFATEYDIVLAFRSKWIIPEHTIRQSRIVLNFHPGPPEHPGSASANWALYNGDASFGCTAHFVSKEIDAGEIIGVRRFPIGHDDTIGSILEKTYLLATEMFSDIFEKIVAHEKIEPSGDVWTGKARRMKSIEEINFIDMSMDEAEVVRRIRATHHPDFPVSLRLPIDADVHLKID